MNKATALLIVALLISCSRKSESTEEILTPTSEPSVGQIDEGNYATEDRTSDLIVEDVTDSTFNFSITVTTANAACTGEVQGTARYNATISAWEFGEGESCSLTFVVDGDMVIVTEKGDCDHGAACSYEGSYGKAGMFSVVGEGVPVLTNVLEYYMALPDEYFTCELERTYSPEQRQAAIQYQNVDSGYLKVKVDELDGVELALFEDRENEQAYLAFVYECGGGCMCSRRHFLRYANGEWEDVYGEHFPDLSELEADGDIITALSLPEKGTIIQVLDADTRQPLADLVWRGGQFELQKK